jgi:hypothetical protein
MAEHQVMKEAMATVAGLAGLAQWSAHDRSERAQSIWSFHAATGDCGRRSRPSKGGSIRITPPQPWILASTQREWNLSRKPATWDGFFTALADTTIPNDFLGDAERTHNSQTRDPFAGWRE